VCLGPGNRKSEKKQKGRAMKEGIDSTAYNNEQGNRARKLFAAVVLAALDDAIADDKKFGNGPDRSPAGPAPRTGARC
jgi:hypothetical protein